MVNGADRTSNSSSRLKRNNPHSSRLASSRPSNIVVHPPSRSSSPDQINGDSTPTRVTGLQVQTPLTPHTPSYPSSHPSHPSNPTNTALRSRLMSLISPRSSNYERLEGGHGPARTGAPPGALSKRLPCGIGQWGWKKFAVVALIIVGGVWLFGPREGRVPWRKSAYPYADDVTTKKTTPAHTTHDAFENVPPPDTTAPTLPFPLDVKPIPPSPAHPTSFPSDPNPLLTTHCTTPSSPHLPLTQWALMIDAGSTGSRIHIYKFHNCLASPSYEYEQFKMTQPGLSAYAGKPQRAAESLDVLLREAERVVPRERWACTPVAVKATAGLRLLPGSEAQEILRAVEKRLREKYYFQVPERDGVVIMDGKDEGVYAWITANYLLDTIKADTPPDTPTYAVLDLGGASTQIVFEPTFPPASSSSSSTTTTHKTLEEGEHKYTLTFGGRTHVLYQHSYLGYGLMRARQHVHSLVDFMASLRVPSERERKEGWVGNPCIARGMRREVEVEVGGEDGKGRGRKKKVVMSGDEIGSFDACERVVQLVLAKDAICEMKPCSFNGVYQPSLLDSFPHGKVLLLSYFYDRLAPLLPAKLTTPLTVQTLAHLASLTCLGPAAWASHPSWSSSPSLMEELKGRPEWCLDLTFMHALLRLGYEFEEGREVEIGKKVGGTELGWCLGAAIELVGGGEVRCRDGEGEGEVNVHMVD